jgi:hypothetical protein
MPSATTRPVLQPLRRSPRLAATAAVWLGHLTTGCLSNEYVIPPDELARVVELPPQTRGERVRIVQAVGPRRETPTGPGPWLEAEPFPSPGPEVQVDLPYPIQVPAPGSGRPGRGAAPARPGAGSHPVPARPRGGTGLAAWHGNGGGGGGGRSEDLVVVALVILAVATVGLVALSASEGARYDGVAQIAPGQPVHLENELGQERVVPLGGLSRQDLLGVRSALVMDDEGYGLPLLGRRPLDRRGAVFKLDAGALGARVGDEAVTGLAANIQIGGFPWQRLGLLGVLSLGGGTDSSGRTFVRHGVGLEAQGFPLALGRLHAGAFVHGGVQLFSEPDQARRTAPSAGGGLMLELGVSTRLALYLRADATTARLARGDWRTTGTLGLGMAVY